MVLLEPSTDKQPLHIVIAEQLRIKIEAGQYEPGARLPSEFDLGQIFGVSRTTIRKALSNLIQQGLVRSQRGKGSFVSGRQKISISMADPLTHFDIALQEQGYTGHIQSLQYDPIQTNAEIASTLQVSPEATVYCQKKIIYADNVPIALETDYFPENIGQSLSVQLQKSFTYSTLKANNIQLNAGKVKLGSVPANYELSDYLSIPLGMPLLVFDFVVYWQEQQPAACGKVLSRSDWICYTSEMQVAD
ncbi:MAG: GntR family transcriptional regulator [Cyanobacteria bacterium P01_D01_bin.156]